MADTDDYHLNFDEKEISIYVPLAALAIAALFAIGFAYQLIGLLF